MEGKERQAVRTIRWRCLYMDRKCVGGECFRSDNSDDDDDDSVSVFCK